MQQEFYPRLEINLRKLQANTAVEVELFAKHGITVMGVNKVFNGLHETAQAVVSGGIKCIAESRIKNLIALRDLNCQKCLLRSPALSEVSDTIKYADISLNSELEVIRALGVKAQELHKKHSILLMVDFGDLREGIWFENYDLIRTTLVEIQKASHLEIYGLGTNFNCFGAIKPTLKNGNDFVKLARQLESDLKIKFPFLSGGNCTSYHLLDKGTWPEGMNHIRIGGLHQFGIEYIDTKYVEGFYHSTMDVKRVVSDLYRLKVEVIEVNSKPTVPVGESGVDAFLEKKTFQDRGIRRRALLAVGRQDLPCNNIWPVDSAIFVLGQSSDHTLVDIEDCAKDYQLGDIIEFEIDYTALLHACNSPGIKKVFVHD